VSSNTNHRALLLLAVLGAIGAAACHDEGPADDDSPSECLTIDYQDCALLYPPTWDQVWQQTISTTCSGGGSACHAGDLGLTFGDQDTAYAGLVHELRPGDPNCSHLMLRLESEDPDFRMPPGNTPLAAGARCSIATWIANGAAQD
jgi:hypothetical protein